MTQIAFLVPCTSNKRPQWKSIHDSYLLQYTLKSLMETASPEYEYCVYVGYDEDDRIYSKEDVPHTLNTYVTDHPHIQVRCIPFRGIAKGHVTKMWNVLFDQAYWDNMDYFFQCGDDMSFQTSGWVHACVLALREQHDIGIVGPKNNDRMFMTQGMVSRKHMEIFGYFFPESIINWCCDDWYNLIYKPSFFRILTEHFCDNMGGDPRYLINNDVHFRVSKINALRREIQPVVEADKRRLVVYLQEHPI